MQRPLLAEWAAQRDAIGVAMARSKRQGDKAWREAQAAFAGFLERLRAYRVLDPACGSGNFLYLALKALKDVEHQANFEAEALGLPRQHDLTGPHNVLGIELNEYAAELARLTVWIGELQWRIQRGYAFKLNPVLEPLDHIECRDALMNAGWQRGGMAEGGCGGRQSAVRRRQEDARRAGRRVHRATAQALQGRVPGGADFVCYWFDKARAQIAAGELQRAGLVATNSIRGGASRAVLEAIVRETRVFEAWSDKPMGQRRCGGAGVAPGIRSRGAASGLGPDGRQAQAVGADLSAPSGAEMVVDTRAHRQCELERYGVHSGTQKGGSFDVPGNQARAWLQLPNVHGESNSAVLAPWINGLDITRRPRDFWIIDFGDRASEETCPFRSKPLGNS